MKVDLSSHWLLSDSILRFPTSSYSSCLLQVQLCFLNNRKICRVKSTETLSSHAFTISKTKITSCCICKEDHTIEDCAQLKSKMHREKLDLLRHSGVCFGCLKPGHVSKNCTNCLTCNVCNSKHPTMLHIAAKPRASEQPKNAVFPQQTCARTGAGKQECVLSIVPVQVKAKNGNKILTTYAFLDPGSSATFCTERLMRQLNMDGIQAQIFLRTMGQAHTVKTHVLTGLEVAGYDDNRFLDLPEVHTQQTMPVTTHNIITEKDLREWPYLQKIKVPKLDAGVDLLIGTNAPKLLEQPWHWTLCCSNPIGVGGERPT